MPLQRSQQELLIILLSEEECLKLLSISSYMKNLPKKKGCLSLTFKKVTKLSTAKMDLFIPTWKN